MGNLELGLKRCAMWEAAWHSPLANSARSGALNLVLSAKVRAIHPRGLRGNSLRSAGPVRRAYVGELREQVFVGPDLILCHLSI